MKNNKAGEIREEANGTTTVGIKTNDGIIIAADTKVSKFISTSKKDISKILPIHSKAAMTMAGVVGHAQQIHDKIKNKAQLYESRRGREMPIKSITYSMREIFGEEHYHVAPIVAGVDENGNHLYEVGPVGSIIEYNDFTSTGSGYQFATGVLEKNYNENMSLKEAKELALNAIKTAKERDNFTGNGFMICVITKDGLETRKFDEMPDEI